MAEATLKLDLGQKAAKKPTAEDQFRESVEDAALIVEKLSLICNSFEEMVELLKAAQTNDATLKLILAACK